VADAARVSWFVAANPGPLTLDGTRCYAIGCERLVLLDPGPAVPGQLERLEEMVAGRPVEAICLTHAHSDHSGAAEAAMAAFGAPAAASADTLDRIGLTGRALEAGDTVPVDGGSSALRAVPTPGHSADHTGYLLEPGRALFTGDLVLGEGSSAVLHPDGDVGACLASFGRLLFLRPRTVYPGHGPPADDGEILLKAYRDHRLERHVEVVAAVRAGARSVERISRTVYGDLQGALEAAARASIRAHVVYMREQGDEVAAIEGLDDVRALPEEA
jgi:glyoxylase-like metal-dependent hydrolase (beta-lactamase superfamily II)